jgi:hypothetical protein
MNMGRSHSMICYGMDDTLYTVNFYHRSEERQTLEYPGAPEEVEIEQVFFQGKPVEVSDEQIKRFEDAAWENLEEEDPPRNREWECNYER